MFPIYTPSFLRDEYQQRVDAALERGKRVDTDRRINGENLVTRLRAWFSGRRRTRVQRARTVDSRI